MTVFSTHRLLDVAILALLFGIAHECRLALTAPAAVYDQERIDQTYRRAVLSTQSDHPRRTPYRGELWNEFRRANFTGEAPLEMPPFVIACPRVFAGRPPSKDQRSR